MCSIEHSKTIDMYSYLYSHYNDSNNYDFNENSSVTLAESLHQENLSLKAEVARLTNEIDQLKRQHAKQIENLQRQIENLQHQINQLTRQ